jgi:hypothetical protein
VTRRAERSHYIDPNGTKVRTVKFYCMSDAEADAVEAAGQAVAPAKSFTPGLCAGEPFDAPEPWPSDATAREFPPNCDGGGYPETQPTAADALIALHDHKDEP